MMIRTVNVLELYYWKIAKEAFESIENNHFSNFKMVIFT